MILIQDGSPREKLKNPAPHMSSARIAQACDTETI